jgi:pimeloyl-ACP methyl ester carboxylesterase
VTDAPCPVPVLRAVLLVLLLAVAGCAGTPAGDPAATTAAFPTTGVRPGCARPGDVVRDVGIERTAHLQVTLLLTGQGPHGVALFPQSDGDICQFADLAHHLADLGYRVVTFGPWSNPYARPAALAYQALLDAGARHAVVIGASQGATVALASAAALSPPPAGVVSLSAESSGGDGSDALAGARAYPGPVLLAGTEDDIYAPGGVTRRIAELHPGTEQVLLFDGSAHGVELLPRTSDTIDTFLSHTLAP